ncbi:hypothetical protein RYH80_11500 [Halobaculum sp. MBLA0147]|uniref:hypothetical protein n=1 Tax=Halobaculum sp. MBLA0147 TaxID=3079934 RepID=UPI0035246395
MPSRRTRRAVVAGLGGSLGLGGLALAVDGPTLFGDRDTPGADGFTAGTVPATADSVVGLAHDGGPLPDPVTAATTGLATRAAFDGVPAPLRRLAATGNEPLETTDGDDLAIPRLGKTLTVTTEAGTAVVVWAAWTDERLREFVAAAGDDTVATDTRLDRRTYESGTVAAARLADTAAVVGDPAPVAETLATWHGDGDSLGGATLGTYSRTPREDPLRLSLARRPVALAALAPDDRRTVYGAVDRQYGSVAADGRLRLVTTGESLDPTRLATALRTDLGLADGDASVLDVPPSAREHLSVGTDGDAATVLFDPPVDADGRTLRALVAGLTRLTLGR